jgi:hypothetical protein
MKVFLHFPTYFWEALGDREFFAYTHSTEGYFPSFQNLNLPKVLTEPLQHLPLLWITPSMVDV